MSKLYAVKVEIDGQTVALPPLAYEYLKEAHKELELFWVSWHRIQKHKGKVAECSLAPCVRINQLLARWQEVET